MNPAASQSRGAGPGDPASLRIAQVGYGEVGRIFAAALAKAGVREVRAYDVLVTEPAWRTEARDRAARDGVVLDEGLASALGHADLVICAVTAAASLQAGGEIAHACAQGAFVLDLNSASPRTKGECARTLARAGARYVEAAVMGAVPPHGIRVPMLLGGPHAPALLPALERLGFDATVGSAEYGVVSAIKLCRSIVVKGMEALAVESFLAARRYGVEREVLASLAETYPGMDWERQGTYFWKRVVQHGRRRAEEMREAAVTVADAGIAPRMAAATAEVQAWIAAMRAGGAFEGLAADAGWRELADRIEEGAQEPAQGPAGSMP